MKAILLAAGFGTRLRPITNTIPKCLVPIRGKPLIQLWLEKLISAHIELILINTHYLSGQVQNYISNSLYKNKCIVVFEPELLGTAGTLLNNLNFFEGKDGMLIHADNYCLEDLSNFINAHKNRPIECLMTMMIFKSPNPSDCGIVELDDHGIVVGFHEKVSNPPGNLANGAVYILSSEMINIIKTDFVTKTDFSTEILGHFVGKIYTFLTEDLFIDIGTLENYNSVNGR
uniref:nucleotidyltransferase family protein n=1 Tax=Bacteroidota TaxID=976 RepID=UPI0040484FD8